MTDAPQDLQNLAARLFAVPHLTQIRPAAAAIGGPLTSVDKSCPQLLQNLTLSLLSAAHFGHLMVSFHLSKAVSHLTAK